MPAQDYKPAVDNNPDNPGKPSLQTQLGFGTPASSSDIPSNPSNPSNPKNGVVYKNNTTKPTIPLSIKEEEGVPSSLNKPIPPPLHETTRHGNSGTHPHSVTATRVDKAHNNSYNNKHKKKNISGNIPKPGGDNIYMRPKLAEGGRDRSPRTGRDRRGKKGGGISEREKQRIVKDYSGRPEVLL